MQLVLGPTACTARCCHTEACSWLLLVGAFGVILVPHQSWLCMAVLIHFLVVVALFLPQALAKANVVPAGSRW